MTHRDNTRFNVVFLMVLIISVTLACTLTGIEAQDNRLSQNYQDELEEDPSQATDTSQPTKTPIKTPLPAKFPPPGSIKQNIYPWSLTTLLSANPSDVRWNYAYQY
jgi:hypothetical protein